ncbi:MAG: hypothetical protein GAK45_00041 [Pseudomonas citronellolis]|nr:MAG: hypothetical protein GAK45_00041 [Pseudomonas citronellolis]
MSPALPYRLFTVELKRREQLGPALTRFVFGGPEVAQMGTLAADQRIKIFFPDAQGRAPQLAGDDPAWYQNYRSLDAAVRPPVRTYTLRALRAEQQEVDVEFVLHGETGPASTWATHARVGDRLQFAAPNALYQGDPGGYEWKPPAGVREVLLIADETALPAVAGIFEQLASLETPPRVQAYLEIPEDADRLALAGLSGAEVHWLPRAGGEVPVEHGQRMVEAVHRARLPAPGQALDPAVQELAEIDIEQEILWEQASSAETGFYAWVAGETAAVMTIRRYLVRERQIDKRSLALMGYWRMGRVLE